MTKKNKKVAFGDLKSGAKFRYQKVIYLKDDLHVSVRISNGAVDGLPCIVSNTLVTPIKIKIGAV